MAGTVTHYFFSKDVLDRFKGNKNLIVDCDLVGIYAQNTDPFNFYSIYFPILKGSNKVRGYSHTLHTEKIDEFFSLLIDEIKFRKLTKDVEVMSFLYGMIMHYVLDSNIHPFVEYKCGSLEKKDKSTYKYNGKHHEMETFLDIYCLEKRGINPKKYKAHKEIFKVDSFNDNLKDILDYTYKEIYGLDNYGKLYLKSIKDMKITFRLCRYDPFGVKNKAYFLFDLIKPKSILNAKFLSYGRKYKNGSYYLNNNHDKWFYPYDKNVTFNYSFDDIYNNSINTCVDIIKKVNFYLYDNKNIDIHKLFNLSYLTGLDLKHKNDIPTYSF